MADNISKEEMKVTDASTQVRSTDANIHKSMATINDDLENYIIDMAKSYGMSDDEIKNLSEYSFEQKVDRIALQATRVPEKSKKVEFEQGVEDAKKNVEETKKRLVEEYEASLKFANSVYKEMDSQLENLWQDIQKDITEKNKIIENVKKLQEEIDKSKKESDELEKNINALEDEINKLNEEKNNLFKKTDLTEDDHKRLNEINSMISEKNGFLKSYTDKQATLEDSLSDDKKSIDDMNKKIDEFKNIDDRKAKYDSLKEFCDTSRNKDIEVAKKLKEDLAKQGIIVTGEIEDNRDIYSDSGIINNEKIKSDETGIGEQINTYFENSENQKGEQSKNGNEVAKKIQPIQQPVQQTVNKNLNKEKFIQQPVQQQVQQPDNKFSKQEPAPIAVSDIQKIKNFIDSNEEDKFENINSILPSLLALKDSKNLSKSDKATLKECSKSIEEHEINKDIDINEFDDSAKVVFGKNSDLAKLFDMQGKKNIISEYVKMQPSQRSQIADDIKDYYDNKDKYSDEQIADIEKYIISPMNAALVSNLVKSATENKLKKKFNNWLFSLNVDSINKNSNELLDVMDGIKVDEKTDEITDEKSDIDKENSSRKTFGKSIYSPAIEEFENHGGYKKGKQKSDYERSR